ncbi:tetratricopeptide repeat protein [Amylibacter sp.]|nr:tetratricopeptide repeat protein [Amylibacter sp.]
MAKLTINQVLQQAVDAHKAGQLQEAHRLYAVILKAQPKNPDANHNTGLLVVGFGKIELALPFFKTALEANPRNAQFWYSHIIALIKLERFIDAKVLLDQSKSKGIKGADFVQLEKILNEANKALFIKPSNANAYYNMGVIFQEQGKLEEAIEVYNKALAIKPDYVDAYYNMGTALQGQHKLEEAIKAYNKALAIKPGYIDAYNNMGVIFQEQGKLEEAIEVYNKALAIKPDYVDAYYNMGNALLDKHNLEEAIEAYIKAISIKPAHSDAYTNMGKAFEDQGKLEEAKEAYNKALDIQPDNADAHHNLSFAFLSTRDFNQGFLKNEWRWKTKKRDGTFLQSAKPMWNGEKNQRVLVWGEQGIGDEIMFSSTIPELYATSLKILVKCDKRLIPLFERSFPVDVIYFSKDQPVPEDEYDFHIPMGSLPLTFRKSLDSFKKSASGFLKYDMSKTESIKAQLMHKYGKKIIGISWKTASPIRSSLSRNIDLAKLVRALDNSNTQLLCLQYGDISDEIEAVKRDFGIEVVQFSDVDNKNDIDGLAALMAACDTVYTIDNSTAHLSGALGLTTKLMLPYIANWRWGLSGNSSYWYDAVQLYRQSEVNDWYSVLTQIKLQSPRLKRS